MDAFLPIFRNYDHSQIVGWVEIGDDEAERLGEMVIAPEGKIVDGRLEVTGFGLFPQDQFRPIDLSGSD